MLLKFTFLNFFIIVATFGCGRALISTYNLPQIEDRFKLSLITNDEIQYQLRITTEKEYSCANNKIEYIHSIKNESLEIILTEVRLNGDICLTAFAPAQSIVPIGGSIKKIILINGKQMDEYHIVQCPVGECLESKNPLFSSIENNP